LSSCSQCNTLITTPIPDEKNIITYYKSNSYVSHGDKVNPIFDKVYKQVQSRNLNYKQRIIEKYTLSKTLLDYGCGAGTFLSHMVRNGWSGVGVEPDSNARQIALSKKIQVLPLYEIKDSFDCITLFHVLEHVHQLRTTLQALIEKLNKSGVLILALPNFKSYDAHYYKEYWAGYDVPRHLYHFSQKSIFTLAKSFGLNIVATHPMKFDSYYVSLLSEKYKHGKSRLPPAIKTGYISNQRAKSSKEYSSLIYILSR
ncbi:MAG TPA: class I SAM-dependent methyltransferase, partial [Roseivirga sp.]